MVKQLYMLLVAALVLVSVAIPTPAGAQTPNSFPLNDCIKGAFSTEEDFMMTEGEPYDGDPYISDGDVLSFDGKVCARNRDLLAAFNPAGAYSADLGLDALDILNVEQRLMAFSTEIDDPKGGFSAGDLLFTTGAVIPNLALVGAFGIDYDIGLDAVQLIGSRDAVGEFVAALPNVPRDVLASEPGRLLELLKKHEVDIWFSVEGTWGDPKEPEILDGDLLSATGVEIAGNEVLLPPSTPAGLPTCGVDFGLDAIRTRRTSDQHAAITGLHFSTEILFWGDPTFTDGEVMGLSGSIIALNEKLVNPFQPAADFLGLDALSGAQHSSDPDPMITLIGNESVWDIDGGFVAPGDPGTGLYAPNPGLEPQHPFGWFVPIDGHIPNGIYDFRVPFRKAGDPRPAPGVASGISTSWKIRKWDGVVCQTLPQGTFKDDGNGWFKYSEYQQHRYGDILCPDWGIVLAVWDTLNDPNVLDKDGHYVLWLEWRQTNGGPILQEPADHHVQLDNTKPVIKNLELRLPDGTKVEPCGGAKAGANILHVYGEFEDDYFSGYRLRLSGGSPPKDVWYGWHHYWDGTPEVANVDGQGTTPAPGLRFLRTIDMTDLGDSYTACCYALRLWVSDRSIRHNFNAHFAYPQQPSWAWPDDFLTFAASP